jgi:hypothetical protein
MGEERMDCLSPIEEGPATVHTRHSNLVAKIAVVTGLLVGLVTTGAEAGSCIATGTSGSVVDCRCTYISDGTVDDLFVGTENGWSASVVRLCPIFAAGCEPTLDPDGCTVIDDNGCAPKLGANGKPIIEQRQIILVSGHALQKGGVPAPQPFEFQAREGEKVFVECFSETGNGPLGFVIANPDEELAKETGVPIPKINP